MSNLVYLCLPYGGDGNCFHWYVLDTDAETCNLDIEMSDCNLRPFFGCALFNSKIYAIGGEVQEFDEELYKTENLPINNVQIFDTISRKWRDGPKMLAPRISPTVVTLDDGIYVFGCDDSFVKPWAEFYDGDGAGWVSLPAPPREIVISWGVQGRAVFGTSKILLWSKHLFCLYNAREKNWHFIESPQCPPPRNAPYHSSSLYSTSVAVLDDTLYWCFADVFAFDLATNKGFVCPLYSSELNSGTLDYNVLTDHSSFLVVTGKEELCVIWYKHLGDEKPKVYCRKFQTKGMDLLEVPMKNSEFVVDGNFIEQFAGVHWQNDDEGKHDFNGDNGKPQASSCDTDILVKLSHKMYVQNYNLYAEVEGLRLKVVESAEGVIYLDEAEGDLNDFLEDLGLEEYLVKFEDKDIDMNRLKTMKYDDLKALGFPRECINNLLGALYLNDY